MKLKQTSLADFDPFNVLVDFGEWDVIWDGQEFIGKEYICEFVAKNRFNQYVYFHKCFGEDEVNITFSEESEYVEWFEAVVDNHESGYYLIRALNPHYQTICKELQEC